MNNELSAEVSTHTNDTVPSDLVQTENVNPNLVSVQVHQDACHSEPNTAAVTEPSASGSNAPQQDAALLSPPDESRVVQRQVFVSTLEDETQSDPELDYADSDASSMQSYSRSSFLSTESVPSNLDSYGQPPMTFAVSIVPVHNSLPPLRHSLHVRNPSVHGSSDSAYLSSSLTTSRSTCDLNSLYVKTPLRRTLSVRSKLSSKSANSRRGANTPLRRLSELPNLTAAFGNRIHESLLNLASSYKRSWSQSDQMVSLSYKSIEAFVSEDSLSGLRTFLSSRSVVIDDRDDNGTTPLILCASKGKADFCRELIAYGADVHAEDNDQWTSLTTAAKEGHHEAIHALLENGARIDHRDIGAWTPLMWACYKGQVEAVRALLSWGADPNGQGQHHMTSLVWAAGRGHTEVVDLLLEKGAKVNIGDKFGTTPLVWACRKGYLDIAEKLLQKGANVDATGMYSWTPLLVATRGNFLDLVQLILDFKPNVNALDKDGGTALTKACKEGYSEIASSVLMAGAYVNMQDRNGDTNLIFASRGGHRTVVESLLKKHADTDCVGKDKKTALYWAVEKGHTSVVKLLLSANADLEHSTKDGDTALLRAVRTKNADIVQLLIDRKARVNCTDKKGDTALHIAMRGRSKRIVEILLRNPKNSQMLYRPNRAGEKPYNIDLSHQKTILGQIFGARRLNTNEENENMLGYDLYSSSMADILSEPSLSMPISVGLYARWGSGKSFLIRKLKEEMNSFARQWVEPLFEFTPLVFLISLIISLFIGFVIMTSSRMWYVGVATAGVVFVVVNLLLAGIWYGSRSKYDWHFWYTWSVALAEQLASFKLVLEVIFCSPPGEQWKEWKDTVQAKPLKFIFAEGAKPTGTGPGANSVIQIVGSLFDIVEHQHGIFASRFYRAFRPRAQGNTTPWKYRRLCGIPYIAIFFMTIFCSLTLIHLVVTFGFESGSTNTTEAITTASPSLHIEKRHLVGSEAWLPTRVRRLARRDDDDDREDDDFEDDDDEHDDDDDEDDLMLDTSTTLGINTRELKGKLISPLLIFLSVLVSVVFVANIHTLARMIKALIFSHRRHLISAVSKFDIMNAESYLPTVRTEVALLIDMVKCLDAFMMQQTRLVVILDGLDSCEQEKVLSVLDAVHTLFNESNGPFIILLAIDPHIITRAIELNATKVFRESSISGHDYLRNIIHLPFYLQNAGLRKVKQAEKASEYLRGRSQTAWNEQETEFVSLATTSAMGGLHHMPVTRHMSSASELGYSIPSNRRLSSESGMSLSVRRNPSKRRLKPSDSVGSSIASNLNRVSAASDLNKVLLTDDYFNDINPRSMRRLMNVVYITGRLLKAFHIEFNWYHLALWVNITEQWPYRASWLIYYYEKNEENVDEKMSLKEVYERVRGLIPATKEIEPFLEMDKDEKKLETFLLMHENVLHIFNLVIFLPFTINLDPYIKKRIKEEQLQLGDPLSPTSAPTSLPWQFGPPMDQANKASSMSWLPKGTTNAMKSFNGSLPPNMNPFMWGYPPFVPPSQSASFLPPSMMQPRSMQDNVVPADAKDKKLSSSSINAIFEMFETVDGVSAHLLPQYKERMVENNVNGKVLLHCNLEDLKPILSMTFGDWELFKMLVKGLREQEIAQEAESLSKARNNTDYNYTQQESYSDQSEISGTDSSVFKRGANRSSFSKDRDDQNLGARRPNKNSLHVKQVTLEEQMIFGALQTLSEEACEDVLEEQARNESFETYYGIDEPTSGGQKDLNGKHLSTEVDVVFMQSSPLLPHTVISCASDIESVAPSVAPSVASSYSPYKGSVSRGSSVKEASAAASPKHLGADPPASLSRTDSFKSDSLCVDQKETPEKRPLSPSRNIVDVSLERPNSLQLDHHTVDIDNSEQLLRNPEVLDLEDAMGLTSYTGSYEANGPKHVTLSEQISTTSNSSLEKLKKLTKKLQRALASQEDDSPGLHSNETESSPLVFGSPLSPQSPTTPETKLARALGSLPNGSTLVEQTESNSTPVKKKVAFGPPSPPRVPAPKSNDTETNL